jgi:hypothetical protein
MERFARVVLGYHGCRAPVAAGLLSGRLSVEEWAPSENAHDWLGHGVYFWEHAPERALEWARRKVARDGRGEQPGVVGAVIQLGDCLDLTNVAHTGLLREAYEQMLEAYRKIGKPVPANTGRDSEMRRRLLDCVVINWLHRRSDSTAHFGTVRGLFQEGGPAYPGAKIMRQTHVQVVVRDKRCILGVFRPNMVS